MERHRDGYTISDDPERLDLDVVWVFLRTAYWSPGVPRETVAAAFAGSLGFGVYAPGGEQVGFARVVTDGAAFAWIADVFVLEPHRGRGLGLWLIETILSLDPFDHLRLVLLATDDAHGLYERFGFVAAAEGRYLALRRGPEVAYGTVRNREVA
jgi:GNAT superfamily N-acetyltransferase